MSKKTKKRNHKHSKHHRRVKRRYNHSHSIHHHVKTKTHKRRRRKEISAMPGSKSVPIFSPPDKKKKEMIPVNIKQPSGSIVPGLRDFIKKGYIPL